MAEERNSNNEPASVGENRPADREARRVTKLTMLPLRDVVVFPYMVIPLFVGRQKSLKAIDMAMKANKEILVVTQKVPSTDDPSPDDIYDVGTVVQIMQMLKLPDGIVKVLVEGIFRARIREYVKSDDVFEVTAEEVPDSPHRSVKVQALMRNVISLFERYVKLNKKIPVEVVVVASNVDSPGRLADIITAHLNLKVPVKQEILQAFDPEERLDKLVEILNREIEILIIEKKISGRVRKQMESIQKEYYLREQVKAIQKELGEVDELQTEIAEYKKKIKAAQMPQHAEEKCIKETERLAKMSFNSAEAGVIRSYLDTMCELPWSKSTADKLEIKRAERILEEDHYGLQEPKARILEYLSVCKLKKSIKGPILCLMGPPGVGKTSIAKSVARSMGRNFVRVSLGGMRDEAEIRGHRRTYVGAMPGRIIQLIKTAKSNNPVFLLDEIDKTGSDWRGDPSSALLEVLDPEQNSTFTDNYLGVSFDLSKVLFLATANIPHTIPEPLRDRMEIINLPGYTEEEKLQIALRYLVGKQMKENGLKKRHIQFQPKAIIHIIRFYSREAGVRECERMIGSICRKVAKQVVTRKHRGRVLITPSSVEKYLGIPKYRHGRAEEKDEVGVVTGLAWTSVGGVTLPIEAVTVPGTGKVIMTGSLGEVMQESARAAVSFVRHHADDYKIEPTFYKKLDIHIHAPEGGVPKDGPSAGVTITTAVISALTDKAVSKDVAMTGEVTLRGKVLPVGGIKEKVLAAFRLGLREIVLPKENGKDLEDIPKEIKQQLRVHLVDDIGQVVGIAFRPTTATPSEPAPPSK
ncbi:MAG: endopeptidase La [Candidatus Riflebacteria bacterium]|nr:endopeptidase La [Candidatus Riflebacteria bacterium]